MIKFFRRIRQRLLSENKFSKYLIYAIGEIILVVIGILIALQINNLNEIKKQHQVRDNYYLSMIQSFQNDLEKIELYQGYLKGVENNIKDFKESVKNSKNFKEASGYIESLNVFTRDIDLNNSIWNSLVNSGDIGLLDETIKSSLLEFWNGYDDWYEGNYANKQHYWDLIKTGLMQNPEINASKTIKSNKALYRVSEDTRNHMEEVKKMLVIVAFREVGNSTALYKMKGFKREIESLISEMKNKLSED